MLRKRGQIMSKDSGQNVAGATEKDMATLRAKLQGSLKLGHLGTLNQIIKALGKTIRAMASGELDSQVGARICNGLGIMRACLETATLGKLGDRIDELEGKRGYGSTIDHQQNCRAH